MLRATGWLITISSLALAGCEHAAEVQEINAGPDQLAFSVENMDQSVDPRRDFYHFAAGGWLERVARPEDKASYSFVETQSQIIRDQLTAIITKAVAEAPEAEKGSPTQLVGDYYNAFMDLDGRRKAGMKPLEGELAKVDAVKSVDDITAFSAEMLRTNAIPFLFAFAQNAGLDDSSRYVIMAAPGSTALEYERDVYRSPDGSQRREAYRKYVHDTLKVAGYGDAEAERVTKVVLDIETELDKAQLSPADKRDFNRLNNPMTLAEAQALLPQVDAAAYIKDVGLPVPENVVTLEPDYFKAVSKMLEDRSLNDFKDYAKYRLIEHYSEILSPDFDEPKRALNEAFTGVATLRPLEERAIEQVKSGLGQPLSQLYIDAYYDEDTRTKTKEMIDYILAAMEQRIPTRDWLSEETKAEAMAKLKAFDNKVGYPDEWIDFSGVAIVPDNPVANEKSLVKFELDRDLAKFGGPVKPDDFNGKSTLPVVMNAAYGLFQNGFTVTAAISQAPTFEPDADPAIRFCRFGAILGHETTHGFDSGGRQFDAKGNLRNWWTPEDAATFAAEANKLVDQTNSTELAPGHAGNGAYWVGENMADVGGIKLAYTALMNYLKDHPDENKEVDGYTQAQRCFIGWTQLWAENATEAYMINVAESANHPPNLYRAVAALQHFDEWYEAFGIQEGDPMWLPPEKRVNTW